MTQVMPEGGKEDQLSFTDRKGGRQKQRNLRKPRTTNVQLRGLIKYFTSCRGARPCAFNKVILKRLCQSRTTRCPSHCPGSSRIWVPSLERTAVVVGTVTNDLRLLELPKLRVCALRFTTQAPSPDHQGRRQVCHLRPAGPVEIRTARTTCLMRGPRFREAKRHFGLAPGQKGSTTAPYVRAKSRKFEQGRGTH
ncbi:60S ribosomal protein L18-like [Hippocampus zosterae]|uniref:60S ribosomal protein L18-like n=1 Tax=Hippocampus zosterae TaxID=109293 RepID=UPI00223E522E|nr:60S ribosomal protein L18-like [Hippocampus zosterae]